MALPADYNDLDDRTQTIMRMLDAQQRAEHWAEVADQLPEGSAANLAALMHGVLAAQLGALDALITMHGDVTHLRERLTHG
jgi:hypothetical protein